MIDKHITNAADFPIDKPWGYDINPDLWYIMTLVPGGMGLLSAAGVDADGHRVEFALCFGNFETTCVFMRSTSEINTDSTRPVQGHTVLEMFKVLHTLTAAGVSLLPQ